MTDFRYDLQDICVELLSLDDPNTLAHEYNTKLLQCLDNHAPIITKTCTVRPNCHIMMGQSKI